MSNKTLIYLASLINDSDKLTVLEKDILLSRIKGKTLKKIGKKYKISAERVRQKEEIAVGKLKKKMYQMVLFNKSYRVNN